MDITCLTNYLKPDTITKTELATLTLEANATEIKVIDKNNLAEYQQNYKVISGKLVSGKPLIHIFSIEDPGNGFVSAEENLEDVFFAKLGQLA